MASLLCRKRLTLECSRAHFGMLSGTDVMVDGKLRAALLIGALVGLVGVPTSLHAQGMPQLERPEILDGAPPAPRQLSELPGGQVGEEGQEVAEVRVQGNRRV